MRSMLDGAPGVQAGSPPRRSSEGTRLPSHSRRFRLQVLHYVERLRDVLSRRDLADHAHDFAIARNDESRPVGKSMADVDAAHILQARGSLVDFNLIGLRDR